jgi:hypothetical protein
MVVAIVVVVVVVEDVEVEGGRCGGGRPISHIIILPSFFFFFGVESGYYVSKYLLLAPNSICYYIKMSVSHPATIICPRLIVILLACGC